MKVPIAAPFSRKRRSLSPLPGLLGGALGGALRIKRDSHGDGGSSDGDSDPSDPDAEPSEPQPPANGTGPLNLHKVGYELVIAMDYKDFFGGEWGGGAGGGAK